MKLTIGWVIQKQIQQVFMLFCCKVAKIINQSITWQSNLHTHLNSRLITSSVSQRSKVTFLQGVTFQMSHIQQRVHILDSGLASGNTSLILKLWCISSAGCGFKSRSWQKCPSARNFTILIALSFGLGPVYSIDIRDVKYPQVITLVFLVQTPSTHACECLSLIVIYFERQDTTIYYATVWDLSNLCKLNHDLPSAILDHIFINIWSAT